MVSTAPRPAKPICPPMTPPPMTAAAPAAATTTPPTNRARDAPLRSTATSRRAASGAPGQAEAADEPGHRGEDTDSHGLTEDGSEDLAPGGAEGPQEGRVPGPLRHQ